MINRLLIATNRTVFLFGLAVAMAFGFGLSASEAKELSARPFTDLYIFGDSLSDSGNLFAALEGAGPPSPPYFNGRFSDGPGGVRTPTGLCPPTGDTFDADGVLFWDLIHPSAAGHRMIAIVAHSTLQALQNRAITARRSDDDD